jgi:hypothetical protein
VRQIVLAVVIAAGCSRSARHSDAFQIRVFDATDLATARASRCEPTRLGFTMNDAGAYVWHPDMMRRYVTFHIDGEGATTLYITRADSRSL